MFNSDAKQDQFVANIYNFKKNGTYLDIGSCHSIISNNTFFFDSLDWRGVCVEIDSSYNYSYNSRKNCIYLNFDARQIDYKKILTENNFPNFIDYLSLDVDTLSLSILESLPLKDFRFGIITIEHDSYLYGDVYKKNQREILIDAGYKLICSDVYVEQAGFDQKKCSFEDWWIDPNYFEEETINYIYCEKSYPSEIINKITKI